MAKLNPAQEAFCREYVSNGANGLQAAKVAGYSSKTAGAIASRLLKNVNVQAYVKELQKKAQEAFTITVEERLRILKRVTDAGLEPFVMGETVRPPNLSAAVSAVGEMNKMLGTGKDSEEDAEPIPVTFNVREPVKPE